MCKCPHFKNQKKKKKTFQVDVKLSIKLKKKVIPVYKTLHLYKD